MFLGYLKNGFVFASKKSDHLMGILGNKIFAFELEFQTLLRWHVIFSPSLQQAHSLVFEVDLKIRERGMNKKKTQKITDFLKKVSQCFLFFLKEELQILSDVQPTFVVFFLSRILLCGLKTTLLFKKMSQFFFLVMCNFFF